MTSTEPHPDILADRRDDPLGEALLLQAVRDGSTAAFGILYARYRSLAVGVASQALPQADAALAEDVAEVSFIRVLTALRNGKGPTDTLRSYLATTVRREAWRAQRRRRRQAEVVEQWAAGEDRSLEPDIDLTAETGADLGSHVLLGEAFRGLSDRWRHVLWLTAVEGRKPAEVAPMLGVSAGSASALAYRARNGLIAAYVAAYRGSTDDASCVAISGRLEAFISAGNATDGFADVVAHLDGCQACREVSRGVDVLGTVLASMAPFGLLTAGLWAKTAGVGAVGLAGAATATGALAAHGAAGTAASTAAGGAGVGTAVAAAAAVAVLAGAAWFGVVRSGADGSDAAAPPAAEAPASTAPGPSDGPSGSTATTAPRPSSPTPAVPGREPVPSPTRPVPSTASTTTPEEPSHGGGSSGSASPTTTRPVTSTTTPATTTTTTASSTTTTQPPVTRPGVLSGRATKGRSGADDKQEPVAGIEVVAYDEEGRLAGSGVTGADGRWSLRSIPTGHYLVVAVVPAAYRPATGPDPYEGGATWGTILGSVDVEGQPVDLVDLRLVDR